MTTEARKNAPLLKPKPEKYFPISHRKFKPLPNIPQGPRELYIPPREVLTPAASTKLQVANVEPPRKLESIQIPRSIPSTQPPNTLNYQQHKSSSQPSVNTKVPPHSNTAEVKGDELSSRPRVLRQPNKPPYKAVTDHKPSKTKISAFTQHMEILNARKNLPARSPKLSNAEVVHTPQASVKPSSPPPVAESDGANKLEAPPLPEHTPPTSGKTYESDEHTCVSQRGAAVIDENIKPPLSLNTQVSESCTAANLNSELSPTSPLGRPQYLWKDLVDQSKMKCSQPLTPKEIERQETIFELINTESDYLNCLCVLVEFFEKPLMKMGILRNDKVLEIFSNLNEILLFHTDLFKRMTAVYKKQFPVIQKFAFVFSECLDRMKIYSRFVVNYKKCLNKVTELRQTEKRFTWFLEQRHQKTESRHLSLEDLLLEPFQRLCRYPLLFEKILSCTHPDSPDRSDMVQVLYRIREIIHEINEAKQRFEIREEMHLAQSRIKGFGYFDFLAPSRELILEGGLTFLNAKEANSPRLVKVYRQKSFPLRVFLFNDCILLTKHRNKKTGPQYKAIAPPSRVTHVQEVEDVSVKSRIPWRTCNVGWWRNQLTDAFFRFQNPA
ncbi:Dbl homology domain-containing protein [Basidiobolus meristosporus CBS 931.73]|uniref:Dbl homology domain-containing protein n=1 Tax=Basidiobolus meristosporus CBS 931.73 TaxID=1314790 RepID=A0A1Y1Y6A7_9FUNG|nr:Dbl homology domain-containing protein [Basidiobolus meristosporus CBS 931.73]|eukprot:ORX93523.1 Dbl homology domain-containing protein [Basidiobolus meristosporus CBS 931.73]